MASGDILMGSGQTISAGNPPPVGATPILMSGSVVVQVPASSFVTVAFPYSFTGGLIMASGFPGDSAGGFRLCQGGPTSLSQASFRCTTQGDGSLAGQVIRLNWVAFGW